MLKRILPLFDDKVIRAYYVLTLALNAWFVAGVWFFIWSRFMTVGQIGLSDALTFTAGFLMEIPSGVWADRVGRKKAVVLGFGVMILGNLGVAFSSSFNSITLWFFIWVMGYTFQSGALEALIYDHLLKKGKQEAWPEVLSRAQIIAKIGSVICTVIGGFAYQLWFRLPWLLASGASVIGLGFALFLPGKQKVDKKTTSEVLASRKHIIEGARVIVGKHLLSVSIIALLVGAISFLFNWGILRPVVGQHFGYTPATLPLLQALSSIMIIIVLTLLARHLKGKKIVRFAIVVGGMVYGLAYVGFSLPLGLLLGGSIFILADICSTILAVSYSTFINLHTKSEHRATTLSFVSFLQRAPYAVLAITIGTLAERNLVANFCLALGLATIIIVILAAPSALKQEEKVIKI